MDYPIELTPDDNGTIMATCPDLPEVTTYGDDRESALARAVDAMETALAWRIRARLDIPAASSGTVRVTLPALVALKVALYQGMREQGLTKADLARRLNWHYQQVDSALDFQRGSTVQILETALKAVNRQIIVVGEAHR